MTLRLSQPSLLPPRRVFFVYNFACILDKPVIHSLPSPAKVQDASLISDGISATPRQLRAQLCIAHLPSGIRAQHCILRLAPDRPLRLGQAALWALEPQNLRLSPNSLIAALGKSGFECLHRRRGILVLEPRVISVCPAPLAAALMQRSLDPELLLRAGAPHNGCFDSIALGVHQHPIQNQAQELIPQRGGLPTPAGPKISQ